MSEEHAWHTLTVEQVRTAIDAPEGGLTTDEAARRLDTYGPNALPMAQRDSRLTTLLKQFKSLMIAFLMVAMVVTLAQREFIDSAAIALVLVFNTAIGYWQARKAEADVEALQSYSQHEATVVRGKTQRIDATEVVPGDTVRLEPGAMVPADLRLTETNGLQVNESMLTGEVLPVTKREMTVASDAPLGDRVDMCFSGTLVVAGRGTGVVVATGTDTELGTIAELVNASPPKTPLQILLGRLERAVGIFLVAVAAVIFVSSLIMGAPLSETLRTTVALVISVMPEALPVVLSVAMGVGVSRMAKHRAIVRNLPSVETLGSANVIGSDKTGTLTVNRMTVERIWTPGEGTTTASDLGALSRTQLQSLRTGATTNDATTTGGNANALMGDAVDVAMASVALECGAVDHAEREREHLADMPYEPELAFSQSVTREGGKIVLHAKGAPETIVGFCELMATEAGDVPLDHDAVMRVVHEMAEDGLRVIATAHAVLSDAPEGTLALPHHLILTGLQGMIDPPREGVKDAITQCRESGIHVMMITGDHPVTASAIGRRLGLTGGEPLTGAEMATLGDMELTTRLHGTSIAARMSPQDKLRIVQVLQHDRKTVAITGDGVNDAPALRAASIGVAMGASGTDVAREAADLVLTDDNFVTIVEAVRQGRVTFSSIRKATFFLISNGLAALIAVAVNTFTDLPLIFLPVMLLILNVVTDGVQDIALAFEKGEGDELSQPPRPHDEGVLNRTMWLRTLISGTWMGIGTLLVYRVAHQLGLELDHCRTLALITLVMFNFFQAFSARAERKSVFSLNPFGNPLLVISAFLALAIQYGLTVWPAAANLIGLAPLSWQEWLLCAAIGSTVLWIVEAEKLVRRLNSNRKHVTAEAELVGT